MTAQSAIDTRPARPDAAPRMTPRRNRPPPTVRSVTLKLVLHTKPAALNMFFTVSLYPDGSPCHLWTKCLDRGVQAMMSVPSRFAAVLWQHGFPTDFIIHHLHGDSFEPAGMVEGHPDIHTCRSPTDLLAKVLKTEFWRSTSNKEVRVSE